MKIQTVQIHSQKELEEIFLNSIEGLPGEPRLIEKSLETDYGCVSLGADEKARLAVFFPTLNRDDGALVRLLAIEGWLKRHCKLLERLFQKKAADLSKEFRLILVAPEFSRELEEAARGIRRGLELYRYRAVNVNRQVALFLDPLFQENGSRVPESKPSSVSKIKQESASTGNVRLTSEEKQFFSVGSPPN